jgi:hypothetical protein
MNRMKHVDSQRIWNAYSARHTLFWSDSPAREERDFRLARIGLVVSITLLGIVGFVEIAFLATLLWQFFS